MPDGEADKDIYGHYRLDGVAERIELQRRILFRVGDKKDIKQSYLENAWRSLQFEREII